MLKDWLTANINLVIGLSVGGALLLILLLLICFCRCVSNRSRLFICIIDEVIIIIWYLYFFSRGKTYITSVENPTVG